MSIGLRLFFWWTTAPPPPPPPPPLPDPQEEPDEIFYDSDAFGDDAIGELVMCEGPMAGTRADPLPGADHWVFLNGVRSIGVKISSVSASRDLGQRGNMRFTMARTPDTTFTIPQVGWTVQLSWHDHLQWAGVVENVRLVNREGSHDTVLEVSIDCASWERIAERRVTNTNYENQTTREIYRDVLQNILEDEDIIEGVIDPGITLSLVGPRESSEYIRVSELLRDVAEASGGSYDIDPFRRLNFRKDTLGAGALVMGSLVALHEAETSIERKNYRNVQVMRAKGASGDTEHIFIRENQAEILARQSFEGGTGRYEAFDSIEHPFSDDLADLGRLAVAAAVVNLRTFGQHARTLSGSLNFPRYRLGDIVTANFPEHNAFGSWQLAGVRYRAIQDRLFADYELVQTSALQRNFQGWLKITGAGRAVVQIPGTPVFSNSLRFTASGSWTVPDANGDGSDVEVSFDVRGAGGGGTAAWRNINPNGRDLEFYFDVCGGSFENVGYPEPGLNGFPGGRGIAFRELPVGTIVTVVCGSGGAGSSFACFPTYEPNPASHGSNDTYIMIDGAIVARGNGGGGGGTSQGAGTGSGDFAETGSGASGGQGGAIRLGSGTSGANGYVDISY